MSGILPTVRYLIVCEDVQLDPSNPKRITLFGLLSRIRSLNQPPFPLTYEELCVYLQLTECRGTGAARIDIQHADSGDLIYRSLTRSIAFGSDPLEIYGAVFRLRDCLFPDAGLHWVQFWYDDQMIAQQPLLLR